MTREIADLAVNKSFVSPCHRTKRLVHFFRAVALFSVPIRAAQHGLRRRK
ncbi:MAG: hypothetical protein ACRCTQ_06200 [Brevinemataceae bacterium]